MKRKLQLRLPWKALEDIKSGKDFEELQRIRDIKMSSAPTPTRQESVVDVEYQNIAMELEMKKLLM